MIKKFFVCFLIFNFCVNYSLASEWVTITAENGNVADLDLESINMAVDTVEYDIKIEKDGYSYINRFSSELFKKGAPTAVILYSKYKDNILVKQETVPKRIYKPLKRGTLQDEIFDVLSKELEQDKFKKGQSTWDKYLKRQKKTVLEKWNPKNKKFNNYNPKYIYKESETPVYNNKLSLYIDRNGEIVNRQSSDIYEQITQINKLEKLPEEYTAQTFKLNVDMKYYKYVGAKKQNKKKITKNSPVEATITVAKNSRPPVLGHIQYGFLQAYRKTTNADIDFLTDKELPFLLYLVAIPVGAAYLICVPIMGYIVFGLLFFISGGDTSDL